MNTASFTNELCPLNSFSVFPDFNPWILQRAKNSIYFLNIPNCNVLWHHFFKNRSYFEQIKLTPSPSRHPPGDEYFLTKDYLMVWSNEALSSWLLSLEKLTEVIPLLWALSNFLRHCPVRIFQTWKKGTCFNIFFKQENQESELSLVHVSCWVLKLFINAFDHLC